MPGRPAHSSRRRFLKTSVAAAAVAATPLILSADDKSGSKAKRVGAGEHTYECQHYWGELPKTVQWGATHGVTIDREGLIYIKHQNGGSQPMDAIVVFDPTGKAVRSFGKEYHGGGHGIDIREEGGEEFLYLSDVKHCQVIKTDLKGDVVWKKDFPQEPGVYKDGAGYRPTNVAFAPDGGLYIGDGYGSHYIHQYDKDAKWVRTWGGAGSEPGKMKTPHGMWFDDRPGRTPSLAVADRANARLQYFTPTGEHLGFVNDLLFPADIDIQGEVMLVPDLHARITLLDKDNNVITHLGDDAEWRAAVLGDGMKMRRERDRWLDGKFIHPHDACFDKDGNIYVTEWVEGGRVTFLKKLA
ncbi:twin-arginine translocation signal domain-containing protein [Blastopirellula sp. JC732]|uniref:Twin-arginine translocation signal domain-containing protein n=1 Tax=Blastopirellula sediminis TaxID=2894196 RepID=A0A9X1MPC1_9BACT|nr:twin-arginine translocation signal domain-containing protein [Blastopirellula sediminis]MCC9605838.1 twin-arginine translocation signal domain-containing protein [Blastopirellula sediminis]MCC9630863.1 twin-arginine translocation signal domain-containing protein [Blastopirellula sediminis]